MMHKRGSFVVDLLFNERGGSVFVYVYYALLCVLSSFAIILTRKRELVTLL